MQSKFKILNNTDTLTISNKSFLKHFKEMKLDFKLYEKAIDIEDIEFQEYQNMLNYSLIIEEIPKGSKILQIGINNSLLMEKLHSDYECWELSDLDFLLGKEKLVSEIPSISKYGDSAKKLKNAYKYFDFIYSVSFFDKVIFDSTNNSYEEILKRLYFLTRSKGYNNICFKVLVDEEENKLNPFLYFFFKNVKYSKILNDYIDPRYLPKDNDLLLLRSKNDNKANSFSYNILQQSNFQKNYKLLPLRTYANSKYYLQKHPAYIFHHLIKCGGTSIHNALKNWFNVEFDHLVEPDNVNNFSKYRYNLENITSDTCIVGHFAQEGIFVHQRYPEIQDKNSRIKVFTFVRDPLQFSISFYYYTLGKGKFQNIKLQEHLEYQKNFLSYFLNCDESNYKKVMDQYFFIGITEQMQLSFDKMANILNKKRVFVPYVNKSEKDSQILELNEKFKENFRKRNDLDYKIYEYCLEKFFKIN